MGSLFVSLRNSAASMGVFERGIMVVQGNVTNANTPGYARQRQVLVAMASDLDAGLAGGVRSGGTLDLRSSYAEQSVRRSLNSLGQASELAAQLSRMEPVFDVQEGAGVGGAIQSLFESFSALAVAPNDGSARQVVLQSAGNLALAFRQAAAGLTTAQADAGRGLVTEAAKINSTLEKMQQINHQFKQDFRAQNDAGLNAQMNTLLEDLSASMNYTVLRAPDGSVSIYAGGQSPVLMGERLYGLTADVSGIPARLLDHQGSDILAQVSEGRVAALGALYNDRIPGYMADFDRLASTLADAVNGQLSAGLDRSGNTPAVDLFTYNAALGAARTLTVTSLTADDLAAASAGAPGGNGNAVALAALAGERLVSGSTFTQFYGAIAARAGQDLSAASADLQIQSALSVQARQMRDDISKVNLDEEAITLLEFQRGYEAAARMVMTLDEMTQTLFEMIR
jgi:flagellar hook-associated protein 1 FlgK